MELVIDAKIIFAALIKAGSTADLITSPKLELNWSTRYLFQAMLELFTSDIIWIP